MDLSKVEGIKKVKDDRELSRSAISNRLIWTTINLSMIWTDLIMFYAFKILVENQKLSTTSNTDA